MSKQGNIVQETKKIKTNIHLGTEKLFVPKGS